MHLHYWDFTRVLLSSNLPNPLNDFYLYCLMLGFAGGFELIYPVFKYEKIKDQIHYLIFQRQKIFPEKLLVYTLTVPKLRRSQNISKKHLNKINVYFFLFTCILIGFKCCSMLLFQMAMLNIKVWFINVKLLWFMIQSFYQIYQKSHEMSSYTLTVNVAMLSFNTNLQCCFISVTF